MKLHSFLILYLSLHQTFWISQSGGIVSNLLESGVVDDDALYSSNVNDVACTDDPCNKRISYAGPEWSAGRPGHTPTRRRLACEKTIEDSCAGQDWSAGRPGNRPFGASSAACPSSITACLGPYGTASRQPHHTGPNTREETFAVTSSTRKYYLDMRKAPPSTMQALQEDQPLKIARHQRRWSCNLAGHHIFVEDLTRMSMSGHLLSIAGLVPFRESPHSS